MAGWAEPLTTSRLQKTYNLMQDPFERAEIASNRYRDWQLNQVGAVYRIMENVFEFIATLNSRRGLPAQL
jgi:hypothetical protein